MSLKCEHKWIYIGNNIVTYNFTSFNYSKYWCRGCGSIKSVSSACDEKTKYQYTTLYKDGHVK